VIRIAGSFADDGLEAFATGLDAAGIVCQCWHFFDDRRVVLSVHAPQEQQQLDAMARLLDAAGARLL
jgi:hypothetical protein